MSQIDIAVRGLEALGFQEGGVLVGVSLRHRTGDLRIVPELKKLRPAPPFGDLGCIPSDHINPCRRGELAQASCRTVGILGSGIATAFQPNDTIYNTATGFFLGTRNSGFRSFRITGQQFTPRRFVAALLPEPADFHFLAWRQRTGFNRGEALVNIDLDAFTIIGIGLLDRRRQPIQRFRDLLALIGLLLVEFDVGGLAAIFGAEQRHHGIEIGLL